MTTGPGLIVDGNNVIGTTADGWWRDRPAAARRLLSRLQCYVETTAVPVVLVLDVPQPDLPGGFHGGVEVDYATRRGRNAGDDRILELLSQAEGGGVEVVTSDRALAGAAAERGAAVLGARTFLDRISAAGC
ncbi:MAG: NYN domain-containing protein [Actinomycetota bacterium]|nr:NYN domain-containing protein [Actinomycetota bacterium]